MLLLLLACLSTSFANDSVNTWGDLRLIQSTLSDFAVDAEGTTIGQSTWLDQRLRLGAEADLSVAKLSTEWELDTPQLLGDTWDIPGTIDERQRHLRSYTVLPRVIKATTYLGNTMVEAGLTTSHWGLGLLANDGAHDPWFGRTDLADRVIRIRATKLPHRTGAQKPVTFLATGAIDMVVADDLMRLSDDQLAFQAIASGLWKGRDGRQWGAYSVFRHQREADRRRATNAVVVDGFADGNWQIGSWQLRAATEVVMMAGATSRATSYNARDQVGILQFGGAGLLEVTKPGSMITMRLRGGLGSGDGNPDDGMTSDFLFDRNFQAGMVLFDQLMGGVDAQSHTLVSDPWLSGQPPDAAEVLATEGAIRRAGFVQPAVRLRVLPMVETRLGSTIAWATAPIAQPFYTYREGGVPTSHHEVASEGRYLGTELNWAAELGPQEPLSEAPIRPTLAVQGGHLFAGPTLAGSDPIIHQLMVVGRLKW